MAIIEGEFMKKLKNTVGKKVAFKDFFADCQFLVILQDKKMFCYDIDNVHDVCKKEYCKKFKKQNNEKKKKES